MPEQIAFINVRPVWARVPLLLLAAGSLFVSWQGLRWGIGDTMADYALDAYDKDPTAAFETAEAAARLAPRDPLSHLTLARLHRVTFDPAEFDAALREYEQAAALAPNDYLVWVEFGRARVSAGDLEGGIAALRRAVALAPRYAEPRWHLGNALLRAGRYDEAFDELRLVADSDPDRYRPQVFNLAWQIYGPDMARVMDAVGRTPEARAQLVGVLTGRGRLDDALNVWSSLSAEQKRAQSATGAALARELYNHAQYRRALQVYAEEGAQGVAPERISNGGFESDIGQPDAQPFGWQVTQPGGAQVALDARVAHAGRRSLRVLFNSSGQLDFNNVSQLVAVEPATRYRLSFFVKTEDVRTAATLYAAASDAAATDPPLGRSAPAPAGTNDWQQVSFEFTTGPKTEAVLVRLVRSGCPQESCPIFGKIWYDDFDLQRSGGRAGSR
jgi:hypothetical protein